MWRDLYLTTPCGWVGWVLRYILDEWITRNWETLWKAVDKEALFSSLACYEHINTMTNNNVPDDCRVYLFPSVLWHWQEWYPACENRVSPQRLSFRWRTIIKGQPANQGSSGNRGVFTGWWNWGGWHVHPTYAGEPSWGCCRNSTVSK